MDLRRCWLRRGATMCACLSRSWLPADNSGNGGTIRWWIATPALRRPARPELRANLHLVQRSAGSISKPIFRIEFQPMPTPCDSDSDRDLSLTSRLTRRERELVELLCQGAANKEIADRLSLSVGTVKK